jgi:hypothetical protein
MKISTTNNILGLSLLEIFLLGIIGFLNFKGSPLYLIILTFQGFFLGFMAYIIMKNWNKD